MKYPWVSISLKVAVNDYCVVRYFYYIYKYTHTKLLRRSAAFPVKTYYSKYRAKDYTIQSDNHAYLSPFTNIRLISNSDFWNLIINKENSKYSIKDIYSNGNSIKINLRHF